MDLLIATRNRDKLREIERAFNLPGLHFTSAIEFPDLPEVIEDGDTLEANAEKKARESAIATGLWALADDTGLEVDALNGAPGVFSARYAGENATYADNVNHLLKKMAGISERSARFRTVMALSSPDGETRTVEGECQGVILDTARGDDGFGYDPVFQPEGWDKTFAELTIEEKNNISHRGLALQAAQRTWGARLQSLVGDR